MRSSERGFTLVEVMVALAVASLAIGALLFLTQSLFAGTQHTFEYRRAYASVQHLLQAWDNESRSSLAIFTPATDVLGNANADGHELDFYTRDAHRVGHFWAYRFDTTAHTVQRYSYRVPGAAPVASEAPITGIVAMSASKLLASSLRYPFLNGYVPKDTPPVNFGYPGVEQTNAIMVVKVKSAAAEREIHLLPGAFPTGFTVIVGTYTPPPTSTPQPSTLFSAQCIQEGTYVYENVSWTSAALTSGLTSISANINDGNGTGWLQGATTIATTSNGSYSWRYNVGAAQDLITGTFTDNFGGVQSTSCSNAGGGPPSTPTPAPVACGPGAPQGTCPVYAVCDHNPVPNGTVEAVATYYNGFGSVGPGYYDWVESCGSVGGTPAPTPTPPGGPPQTPTPAPTPTTPTGIHQCLALWGPNAGQLLTYDPNIGQTQPAECTATPPPSTPTPSSTPTQGSGLSDCMTYLNAGYANGNLPQPFGPGSSAQTGDDYRPFADGSVLHIHKEAGDASSGSGSGGRTGGGYDYACSF